MRDSSRRGRLAGVSLSLCILASNAIADDNSPELPFPMRVVDVEPRAFVLEPNLSTYATLEQLDHVKFRGVPLPDGSLVDFELERVRIDDGDGVVMENGTPIPRLIEADLTMWSGKAMEDEDSDVFFAFSPYGSRGMLFVGGRRYHFTAHAGVDGSWKNSRSRIEFDEPGLESVGIGIRCGTMERHQPNLARVLFEESSGEEQEGSAQNDIKQGFGDNNVLEGATLYECEIAVESDYQFYQLFGDSFATQNYLVSLMGAISARYKSQVKSFFDLEYLGVNSNSSDPWTAGDGAGDVGDLLDEFQAAWKNGKGPVDADLYHIISGASLGGGIAYLDVLCDQEFGFGATADTNGNLTLPVTQGPNTWDFNATAHEIGHQYGTQHTHEYCPPLDECPEMDYWGPCQDEETCINTGTIMSYCNLCAGGESNVTTFFHDDVATKIKKKAKNSCLSSGSPPKSFDLKVKSVAGPTEATKGTNIDLTIELRKGKYTGPVTLQIYLSKDKIVDPLDEPVDTVTTTKKTKTFTVKVPKNMSKGKHFWGVYAEPVLGESDTTNNTKKGNKVSVQNSGG